MSIFSMFKRNAEKDKRIADLSRENIQLRVDLGSRTDEASRLYGTIARLEEALDANPGQPRSGIENDLAEKTDENEELKADVSRLRAMLFPYADATQISGISWDGKNLIGDAKSIQDFRELKNKADQIEVYRQGFKDREAALKKTIDLQRIQMLSFVDAVELFRIRYNISAIELSQLGLGTFVPGNDKEEPMVVLGSIEDHKDAIDFAMQNQATAAKFRQLKEHFVTHQRAVSKLLDRMNELGKKNHVTKEDLRKFAEFRDTLSSLIGRSI